MFDYYPWNHDALFAQLANEKKDNEKFVYYNHKIWLPCLLNPKDHTMPEMICKRNLNRF